MSYKKTASKKDASPIRHSKRIGRPRTRFEKMQLLVTRCPEPIYTYLRGLSPFLGPSLTKMFQDMLERFLEEEPWNHGLLWRKPKTAVTFAGGESGRTGWEQINIQATPDLAKKVAQKAILCGVSKACFCYTAMFWWVQYIYPPNKMLLQNR